MGFLPRIGILLVCAAGVSSIAAEASAWLLGLLILLLAVAHFLQSRSLRLVGARFWPILVFTGGVYVLQAFGRGSDLRLSLQIVFIFAAIRLAGVCCVTRGIAIPRAKPLYRLFLFVHFTSHFATILASEARRMLIARRMAAPKLYRRRGLASLAYSVAAVLERSLMRVERFYAAQSLRGLDA